LNPPPPLPTPLTLGIVLMNLSFVSKSLERY